MQHTDKSRKKVLVVACPICGEELQPKGLHGHLRFKHGLSGNKLETAYEGNVSVERKQQERQTMVDRVSKLHAELREVRRKLKEAEDDDQGGFLSSDDAVEKLKKLYEAEEKRINEELEKLLVETGDHGKSKDRAWDEP